MSHRSTAIRGLAAALLLACALSSGNALAERPYVAVEQRLSAEQMQSTGLDQLSADQLSLLNRLLRDEQANIVSETEVFTRERTRAEDRTAVDSSLKGDFRGWQNGTVFELENGQRWRVVDGEFHATKRLSQPKVTISPGALGSWYMQVEGTGVKAKVKRIEQ